MSSASVGGIARPAAQTGAKAKAELPEAATAAAIVSAMKRMKGDKATSATEEIADGLYLMRCGTDTSSAWRSLLGHGSSFYMLHGAPVEPTASALQGAEAFLKDGPMDPAVDAEALLLADEPQSIERRTLPRVLLANAPPADVPDLAGVAPFFGDHSEVTTVPLPSAPALSLQHARAILSAMSNNEAWIKLESDGPLYVPVADNQKILLGLRPAQGGMDSMFVREAGTITEKANMPKMDALVQRASQALCASHGMELTARATYDLLSVAVDDAEQSAILIDFSWPEPSSVLAAPPASASCKARLRAVAGNERNTAHGLYKDLERLAVLSTCMEELENGAAEDSIAWDATATNAAPLLEQADDFLASLDASNPPAARTFDQAALGPALAERTDLDFTERLWDFIKGAQSYTELRQVLAFLLSSMRKGQLEPTIFRGNTTTIAEIAIECMRANRQMSRTADASVSHLNSLMLKASQPASTARSVVEIGLHKLRRDLESCFLDLKLVIASQLGFFMDAELPLVQQVERLQRLQRVLEVYVLAKGFMDLPSGTLRELMAAALSFYEENDASCCPLFEMDVVPFSAAASQMKQLCSHLVPATWALYATASHGSTQIHHFTSRSAHVSLSMHRPETVGSLDLSNLDDDIAADSSWAALKYLVAERHCLRASKKSVKA